MKNIMKVAVCVLIVFTFASFTKAQSVKTVKGYLCGETMGAHAGQNFLRVGSRVIQIGHNFSISLGDYVNGEMTREQRNSLTKYYGENKKSAGKIGAEYIIKYKTFDDYNSALSVTVTGRMKKILPCRKEVKASGFSD